MKTLKALLPVLFVLTVFSASAQQRQRMNADDKKENIEAMKIAFLTKELDLSPEEAQKFWPVYNAYTDELKKLRENRKERFKDSKNDFSNLNDKEVEKLVDMEISSRQQELDLLKQYHVKFKEVLPIKKVASLYRAEEKFKRQLLERIKERKGSGDGRKPK